MAVQDDAENSKTMPRSKTLTVSFKVIQIDLIAADGSLTDNGVIKTENSTVLLRRHAKRHGHAPRVTSWDVWFTTFGAGALTRLFKLQVVFVEQYETNSRQEASRISKA